MTEKKYTSEQLKNADEMLRKLATVPEEKRMIIVMMTNSFISGMEAQADMDKKTA